MLIFRVTVLYAAILGAFLLTGSPVQESAKVAGVGALGYFLGAASVSEVRSKKGENQ